MTPTDQQFKDTVIGMFDRAAPIYGQVGTKQFTYFGKLLVKQLPVLVGGHALDIAAGRGAILFDAMDDDDHVICTIVFCSHLQYLNHLT